MMTNIEKENALREKASQHYLVCFIDKCPLHDHCLRWQAGQYADPKQLVCKAINPHSSRVGSEQCVMYRSDQRVLMKLGLTKLYHEMPTYMERSIRQHLIDCWGRKQYFEMRRGDRPITPEQQRQVANACRKNGWTGPIVYDGEQEDWEW